MTLIIQGTDFNLEWITREWLAQNDPQEPVREMEEMEKETDYLLAVTAEVSLEELYNQPVDIMAVVEDDLDNHLWWDTKLDAEQFLVIGKVIEVGANVFYNQGTAIDLEGKHLRVQDQFLKSVE